MGVEGVILDAAGGRFTGMVTVRWQLDGNIIGYRVTGSAIEQPGVFKFDIFPGPIYHGTKNSVLQIIESESNPTPLSEPLTWQIRDCVEGPERFVNITFRHR
ncbi:MAG TPA: hypothetical protein VJ714_00300 [Anaerolineae bacterium]|jgi:hypothetical protein|nr:hypothetical protein [Anaerolineae bacterium]